VTPPSDKMGSSTGSCQKILDEARLHKYTHTNHKLNTLNIKYYNFGSSFDTTEFCSEKLHVDAEAIHSTIQGQHLAPKMPPSKVVNAYRVSQYGSTIESKPHTGSCPSASPEGREGLATHS
jgi:hypothetical protein